MMSVRDELDCIVHKNKQKNTSDRHHDQYKQVCVEENEQNDNKKKNLIRIKCYLFK